MSVATNLLPANTSGMETDTSGWAAGANTTLSKSIRFYTGAASLGMTASAAGTVTATTSARVAVTTGSEYMAYAYFANVSAAAGRTATVRVDWYAAVSGGSVISSVTATAVTLPATTSWMTPPPTLLANAPAGAAYASVTITVTGLALGSVVVADVVSFGPPALLAGNLLPYSVQGCEVGVGGWTAYSGCTISQSSAAAYEGWFSLLVTSTAVGLTVVGPTATIPVTPGTEYVGSAWVRPSADGECRLMLKWYDAGNVLIGSPVTESVSVIASTWARCTVVGLAPAGAVSVRIQPAPVATAVGQTWLVDQTAFKVAPKAAGQMLPYNVASMEVDASGWTAVSGCTISRSVDYASEGIASLKVTPAAGVAVDATVELATKVPVTPRQAYQVTPRVRMGPTTERRYLTTRYTWYDAADTILQWTDSQWSLSPTDVGGWYTLQTSTVAPTGAASLSISFRARSPEIAELVYIDDVSMSPGGMAAVVDVVPERYGVSLALQGLTTGGYSYWGLWRMGKDGSMTAVRGPVGDLSKVSVTGDTAVAEDYEAPLGTSITYYLKLWTSTSYRGTSSPSIIIPEPPPTEIVLKDPGLPARQTTAVVAAGGQPQWTRKARQGVNDVRGRARPIIISDVRTSREGTMTLVTETAQDLADMWWLLETGNTLLVQWPHLWGEADAYVQIGDVTEAPIVEYAEYSDRTWSIPLVEVDRPFGGSVGSAGRTWQTVNDNNADWLAVLTAATSWLDVYTGVSGG